MAKKGVHIKYDGDVKFNTMRNSKLWDLLTRPFDGSRVKSLWTEGRVDAYTKYYKITLHPEGSFEVELHPQIVDLINESGIGDLKFMNQLNKKK